MSKTEDTIPTIEVMESHESGKNTVGKNLENVRFVPSGTRSAGRTQTSQESYKSLQNIQVRPFLFKVGQL